jgi:hypothetical protein
VIRADVHRKYVFLIVAVIVLVFAGIQVYWLYIKTVSIIGVLSILTSLGLTATLIALAKINRNELNVSDTQSEAQPKEPINEVEENDDSIAVENAVICNLEADEYFMTVKEELNQVDRLVSDAVNNLVINFRYISKLTKTHHDMVLAIERMAAPEGSKPILELLQKQMVIADKIEQELDAAVTSLQFGDLVTQLIAHTTYQVETLNLVLQRIDRQIAWKGQEKSIDEIHAGISKAMKIANTKGKRKPVVQQGMQMGDIELF